MHYLDKARAIIAERKKRMDVLSTFKEAVERHQKENAAMTTKHENGLLHERTLLTPQLASELMQLNRANRRINPQHVDNISRDIIDGRWLYNADPIRISKSGDMIDGQHRCSAVIQSGIAVEVMIVRGFSDDIVKTVDSNRARSLGDHLHFHGEYNTNALAATISWFFRWERNMLSQGYSRTPTKSEAETILNSNPKLRDSVKFVVSNSACRHLGCGSFLSCLHYIASEYGHEEKVNDFIEKLATGNMLNNNSPVLRLREVLFKNKIARRKMKTHHVNALVIKAWNKFFKGETCGQLKYTDEGSAGEKYPDILV